MAPQVAAAEELVAAANCKQRCTVRDGPFDCRTLGDEVRGDQELLAILAAADVEQVQLVGTDSVADGDSRHFELVAAQRGPPGEHRDVAAVGVDVEVLGIEVADPDLHVRSQYGFDQPRSATIRCSSSIAV